MLVMTLTLEVQAPCFWCNSSQSLAMKNIQDNTHRIPLKSLIVYAYTCVRICFCYFSLLLSLYYSPILNKVLLLDCDKNTLDFVMG